MFYQHYIYIYYIPTLYIYIYYIIYIIYIYLLNVINISWQVEIIHRPEFSEFWIVAPIQVPSFQATSQEFLAVPCLLSHCLWASFTAVVSVLSALRSAELWAGEGQASKGTNICAWFQHMDVVWYNGMLTGFINERGFMAIDKSLAMFGYQKAIGFQWHLNGIICLGWDFGG